MESEIRRLVLFGRKGWRWLLARLQAATKHTVFRRSYLLVALLLLLASTIYWAALGAGLQLHNADQLSDPYLFANWATFHGAVFPADHTFLLKWPLFWLLGRVGISAGSLLLATVGVAVVTVASLVAVLYKINRRPLVLGTLCLGLSLALLLVPTGLFYAKGSLPIGMAMLTTRNIEYAAYMLCLVWLIRAAGFRNRRFWYGVALLSVLIASDKLFLGLSAGGALIMLVGYALAHNWPLVTFAVRWLLGSIAAAAGSVLLLLLVSGLHLTHIVGGSSPYGLVTSGKTVVLGTLYGVLGLLTNAGANPVYDTTALTRLPGTLLPRLFSLSGLAHLVAAAVLVYALLLVWRLVRPSVWALPPRPAKTPLADQLALALLASTVAALAVFIATDHYYPVDARYLTIMVFALAVTAGVTLRKVRWQRPEYLLLSGVVLVLGLVAAGFAAAGAATHQQAALATMDQRDRLVAQTLQHHHVDALVGDYWRVLPIKQLSGGRLTALPLGTCTGATSSLTSSTWQPDLTTHSFAYLLTLNGSLPGFPGCTLPRITATYGQPDAVQVIAGTIARPEEILLFYDQGEQKTASPAGTTASSVTPINLTGLPGTDCNQPTIMNVVAHEDDDLLFLSPDLLHEIQSGDCVRTVFLTAGDDGAGRFYWLDRQQGSEAAYDNMLGSHTPWLQQTVQLAANEYVTLASPRGDPKISLIFFNLPDGGIHGTGFASSGHQSLAKLYSGEIATIRSVDSQSDYTSPQLTAALAMVMAAYEPAQIHTQADVSSAHYPDHSDHITTGKFATAATALYDQVHFGGAITIPVKRYVGYPIHGYPANVSGSDLKQKEAAFLAYARYDDSVCHTALQCIKTPTYGAYLQREYQAGSTD